MGIHDFSIIGLDIFESIGIEEGQLIMITFIVIIELGSC